MASTKTTSFELSWSFTFDNNIPLTASWGYFAAWRMTLQYALVVNSTSDIVKLKGSWSDIDDNIVLGDDVRKITPEM